MSDTMGLAPPDNGAIAAPPKLLSPTAPGLTGAEADRRRAAYADAGNAALSDPAVNPYAPGGAKAVPQVSDTPPAAPQIRPEGAPVGQGAQGIKNAVRDAVKDEWTKAGYPPASVDGILRNVQQESGFNPYALGDYKDGKPTSFGVNQHHDKRAEALAQHLQQERMQGANLSNPVEMARAQTRFSIKEMAGADPIAAKARDALMKETNPSNAYSVFRAAFERPANGPVPMSLIAHDLPPDARAALEEFHAAGARERETILRDKSDLMQLALAEPAGSAKRQKLEDEMHVKIAEREREWEEKWQHPPIMKPVDALQNFGSVATIVGLVGGLFARRHLTAGLAAAGAAMQAINQNNYDQYERSMKTWELQTRSAMEIIKMQREDLASLLKDDDRAWDHKMALVGIKLKEYGMDRELAANERGDIQTTLNTMLTWDRSQNQMRNIVGAMAINNHTMFVNNEEQKYYADHPEQVGKPIPTDEKLRIEESANQKFPIQGMPKAVASTPAKDMEAEVLAETKRQNDAFDAAHPDATAAEKAEVHHKNALAARSEMNKATHQPRSAPAMFMQKYMEDHPEARSQELAEAAAEYRRIGAVETGFASGILGRQVVSLNTVADHISLVREYFQALNNGQIPIANRIANRIATETGKPEVVSFQAGRDIMADEVVRLLTSTGGTAEDRRGMQGHLGDWQSPAQGAGVLKAFERFVGGRFEALEQQYAGNDPKRREHFEMVMLTPKARELYRSVHEGEAGEKSAAPAKASGEVIQNGWRYDATTHAPLGPAP